MGLIPQRQAFLAAHGFLFLAAIIGLSLYFYYKTGPFTIPLGALAIFIGYFYTAKPIQLSYRGVGEIAICFSCSWLSLNFSILPQRLMPKSSCCINWYLRGEAMRKWNYP